MMNSYFDVNIAFAAFCFVISVIILVSVALSEHGKIERSRYFIYIIIVNLMLLLASTAWFLLNGNPVINSPIPLIISECLKASCGPVMLILYTRLVVVILKERTVVSKSIIYAARIAVVVCVADIISIISEPLFSYYSLIDENNQLVRQDWFLLSYIFTFVCIAINSGILIIKRKFLKKRELLSLVAYVVIPALGVVFHMLVEGTPINMVSITVAIVFYFAMIQNDLSKQAHELERELVDSRISVMMSQIKPHFLYNVLSAIAQLCDEDPVKAKKAIVDFSVYLRGNMEALNIKGLISFDKELSHVRGYLDLEEDVYGSALNVVYDIKAGGFMLPPLTIQPIVENAVRHGIGKKEGGGTVKLSVVEKDEEYVVTVVDDGTGYDVNKPHPEARERIGLENVRHRLKMQCDGSFDVFSEVGKGTTVTIRLPKSAGEGGMQ